MKVVLYIEDDTTLRQLVELILKRREDLALVTADTGIAGLQLALEKRPDIILLDLSLPDISGFEVLHKLQADNITNDIPVIAVSGDSMPEDVSKGLQAGFMGYLTKPINIADLFAALDSILKA